MEAPYPIRWISAALRELPAPTDAWADIIGSLSWPIMIAFLVVRFRKYLREILSIVIDRLGTDNVKFGPFELTKDSQLIPLDKDIVIEDSEFTPEDVANLEALFEFIGSAEGETELREWLSVKQGMDFPLVDFMTEPEYASLREQAFADLLGA